MSSELDKVHVFLASFSRKFMGRLKQNESKPVIQPIIQPARGCGAGARGKLAVSCSSTFCSPGDRLSLRSGAVLTPSNPSDPPVSATYSVRGTGTCMTTPIILHGFCSTSIMYISYYQPYIGLHGF